MLVGRQWTSSVLSWGRLCERRESMLNQLCCTSPLRHPSKESLDEFSPNDQQLYLCTSTSTILLTEKCTKSKQSESTCFFCLFVFKDPNRFLLPAVCFSFLHFSMQEKKNAQLKGQKEHRIDSVLCMGGGRLTFLLVGSSTW